MPLNHHLLCVAGLPRAGTTLLCQLLGVHPAIHSEGYTSPLCQTLNQIRHHLSDNEFLLAQLDPDLDGAHGRLVSAFRGFIDGWYGAVGRPWVVDKSRAWLTQLDTAALLDPECRMLVCVRELGQVLGSIEARHQETLLLDFPDHLAGLSRYARADRLLAADGVVGWPLRAIEALRDLPEEAQGRVYYVVFEHLMRDPAGVMDDLYHWLGLPPVAYDWANLPVRPHESDSHYRGKYPHATHAGLRPLAQHTLSPRIQAELRQGFGWFYQTFYPGLLAP
jgi:sulfotransferase